LNTAGSPRLHLGNGQLDVIRKKKEQLKVTREWGGPENQGACSSKKKKKKKGWVQMTGGLGWGLGQ